MEKDNTLGATLMTATVAVFAEYTNPGSWANWDFLPKVVIYRGGNKGLYGLLSRTQAGPGRTVKQEQEEMSLNHVQTFISPSLHFQSGLAPA